MLCLEFPLVVVELELTGKDSVTKTKMVGVNEEHSGAANANPLSP